MNLTSKATSNLGKLPAYARDIPVTDPEEALLFCQGLVSFLINQGQAVGVINSESPKELPAVSVVIPVYNEFETLEVLYDRLCNVLLDCQPDFEIVFVDDGSRDRSLEILLTLQSKDKRIVIIELARNFGHQIAISAGLDHARGQAVIIMDADLQDPPEVLPQFIEKWHEGHDVVYAIRVKRKENWFKRLAYAIFYKLLQRVANIQIPIDAGDFCIMDRKVVDVLVGMPERNRFLRGIRSWIGLDQIGLSYERQGRYAGQTKYTFSRLLYLALDGLVSFSFVPLRIISMIGFGVSIASFAFAAFYFIKKLTVGLNPSGFASLMVAVLFLAGIQLISLGVIGEYVGRIFEEVKHRPLYILRQVTRR